MLKFSILRYYPNMTTEKFINIGIIFDCDGTLDFFPLDDLDIVKKFDKDTDIDYLKEYLLAIKEDIDSEENDLQHYISFYRNEKRFSRIYTVDTNNCLKSIKKIKNKFFKVAQ